MGLKRREIRSNRACPQAQDPAPAANPSRKARPRAGLSVWGWVGGSDDLAAHTMTKFGAHPRNDVG